MTELPFDPKDADLAWLSGLATALIGDAQAGDDIAQEAVLAALARRDRIERPRAWLAGAVRRLAARRIRTESRRRRREAAVARSERMPDAGELLARAETAEAVLAATRRLDEPFRRTVYLRFLEGLTADEIARREGRPADTVRARLRRGLRLLREDLVLRGHSSGAEDWSAWCVLLVSLARTSSGAAGAAAAAAAAVDRTTSAALTLMTMNTKLLAAGAVGALALAWGLWSLSANSIRSNPEPTPGASGSPLAATAAGSPSSNAPLDASPNETTPAARVDATPVADPVAATGPALEGRVVDRGGQPIADARVFARAITSAGDDTEPLAFGRSDAEGSFSLPPIEGSLRAEIELGATAEGYLRGFTSAPAGNAPALLVLPRGREVRGTVLDPTGAGVPDLLLLIYAAGAKVAHVSPSQVQLRAERRRLSGPETGYEEARVRTDSRGRFVAAGLPAGVLGVRSLDPTWTLDDGSSIDRRIRYAELRARPVLGVRLSLATPDERIVKATFRAEVTFANGETTDYGQWVGRGRGSVTFALTPSLLPPDDERTIAAARFHGEVLFVGGRPTSWEAGTVERGMAEVTVAPDPAPGTPSAASTVSALPMTTVDLDVRFDDGTVAIDPVRVAWRHERGDRGGARATAVSAGRYRCELPLGKVELSVDQANASGSLAPWRHRLEIRERTAVQLVTLRRGAAVRITRPPEWTGAWLVRASWRPKPDEPWRGSWTYGTDDRELTLCALRLVEWRFELTSPPLTQPVVRTIRLREAGAVRIVDR